MNDNLRQTTATTTEFYEDRRAGEYMDADAHSACGRAICGPRAFASRSI